MEYPEKNSYRQNRQTVSRHRPGRRPPAGFAPAAAGVLWLAGLLGVSPAFADNIRSFFSDTSWQVADTAGNPLGLAQMVCMNAFNPPACPTNAAVIYGRPGIGWRADLSGLPDARWIWAPGITPETPDASLSRYVFSTTVTLSEAPLAAMIRIAVDDFAELSVNGTGVGATGSISDLAVATDAQNNFASFDVTALMVAGVNTISVTAQNGPDSFTDVTDANYRQNPAGVVVVGTIALPATIFEDHFEATGAGRSLTLNAPVRSAAP